MPPDDLRRCGYGKCPQEQPELQRAETITVEWYEDTHGSRTHSWMDLCSWGCLVGWRQDVDDEEMEAAFAHAREKAQTDPRRWSLVRTDNEPMKDGE